MTVAGLIWFGSCIGSISSPFFYKDDQAPSYHLGIGSLLVANILEFLLFFVFRFAFIWENKLKEKQREALRSQGIISDDPNGLNTTAFEDLTDKTNPNFVYVY